MLKTKDSEVQLNVTKAEEQRKRAETEANKSRTLNAQVSTFSQTETELRSQLNIYVEKFKQVSCVAPIPGLRPSLAPMISLFVFGFGFLIADRLRSSRSKTP